MGSQYGKAAVIRNTDYVAVQSGAWWNSSKYNMEHFGKLLGSCFRLETLLLTVGDTQIDIHICEF